VTLVAEFVSATVAFGIDAPDGSCTTPSRLPENWARTTRLAQRIHANRRVESSFFVIGTSPQRPLTVPLRAKGPAHWQFCDSRHVIRNDVPVSTHNCHFRY